MTMKMEGNALGEDLASDENTLSEHGQKGHESLESQGGMDQ